MAVLNAISLQMFQNKIKISSTVLPVNLTEHLKISRKIYFICNDKHISDNNRKNDSAK